MQSPTNAKTVYTTNDHLGSPRINTDASGQVISRHEYHPFGEEVARAGYGSDTIRKQFTAYERDGETELDFAQARYFNSGSGRFSSPDPIGGKTLNPQSLNRYSYVINNPLNFVDPSGLQCAEANKQEGDECIWVAKGNLYESMWSGQFKEGNDLYDDDYQRIDPSTVDPFTFTTGEINNNDANPNNSANLSGLRGQLVVLGENGDFIPYSNEEISVNTPEQLHNYLAVSRFLEGVSGQDVLPDSMSLSGGWLGVGGQGKLTRDGDIMGGFDGNLMDSLANPMNIVKLAKARPTPSASFMLNKTIRLGRISARDRRDIESGASIGIGGGAIFGGQVMYVPSTGDVVISGGFTTPGVYFGGSYLNPLANVPSLRW